MSNSVSAAARPAISGSLPALGLSALGVVFGDIGTSPLLYTLKTVLGLTADMSDPATTLGLLSLVVWTLIRLFALVRSIGTDRVHP